MTALRSAPGAARSGGGGRSGALSMVPEGYSLSDQQRQRLRKIRRNKGQDAAKNFVQRLDNRGKLEQTPGQGAAPEQTGPGMQDVENSMFGGLQSQFDYLNNRPAFSPTNLPQIPGVQNGFSAERQNASNAVYDEFSRRNEPLFQQETQAFRQRMAEQGIPEGSEQYKRAETQMMQGQNDARLSAQNQAYLTGGQEQSRMFGLASGARGQLYGEQADQYRMPYEQLAAYSPYYQTGAAGQRLQDQFSHENAAREDTQAFTDQQAKQQQQFALEQIRNTPRGGGGSGIMPFEEWARRQDYTANIQQNQMFDQAVINGAGGYQYPQPGFSGGFSSGFGAGVGAGILR